MPEVQALPTPIPVIARSTSQPGWPTPQYTLPVRVVLASALTPLAPTARLENLAELYRLGKGSLLTFAYSPDGVWLGLATQRGIFLYDARTLQEKRFISTPLENLLLAFSTDGRQLAAADRDSRITLYETASGSRVRRLDNGPLGRPLALAFFAGDSQLYIGSSSEISVIWESATGKLAHRWPTSGDAAMAVSADGSLLATSNWSGNIYFWTLAEGRSPGRLWRDSEILAMQFAPDGLTLAAGYGDHSAVIWRLDGGKALHILAGHTDRVISVAYSPNSRLLATGSWDQTVRLWDADSGELLQTLESHTGRIVQVSFTPDGNHLVSAAEDGRLQTWAIPSGVPGTVLVDFAPAGNAIFTPDGKTVLTGAQDGWLRWWDADSGRLQRQVLAHPSGISALQVSPDGRWIVTGGTGGCLRLWLASDGSPQGTLTGPEAWINSLAFSPDSRRLAASTASGLVRIWDTASGQLDQTIATGEQSVLRLAYSPDGRSLAAGAISGSILLLQPGSSSAPRVLRENGAFLSGLAFSPDGQTLASGGDEKTISLWRLAAGSLIFTTASKTSDGLAALAYSASSQVLAASFWDRTLRLYSPISASLLRSYDLPFAARQLSLSPDGRRLALSLDDGTVSVWGIQ